VCFHKKIVNEIYYITEAEKQKYITYYGVKDKDDTNPNNTIYEFELEKYEPYLQKNIYNEGSCIYHVYTNKLYESYDYIGFCQYDTSFKHDTLKKIEEKIKTTEAPIIFYLNFFDWWFLGGQITIIKNYKDIPAGLDSYNKFFSKNYTSDDLIRNRMITCNTFIIPKKMYEKMMAWLTQYYLRDIETDIWDEDGNWRGNPGHIIEGLTGMFLALEICEGAVYEKLEWDHNHAYKL
jgi:hypothetical protein